jgi:excisionase family DNA binding protein
MANDLDVHEAAEVIGVSVATVRDMIRDGRLPAYRATGVPGQPHRVRPDDAQQAARARSITPDDLAGVTAAQAAYVRAEKAWTAAKDHRDQAIADAYARLCERRGVASLGRPSRGVVDALAKAVGMHPVSVSAIVKEQRGGGS